MLTNERIDEIAGPADYWDRRVFARAIEAAATGPLLERIAALEAMEAQQAESQGPIYWQWRRKADLWSLNHVYSYEVFATTDDSEVRTLFTSPQPAQLQARIAELESQLAAVAKDAERLDHIQSVGATVELVEGYPDFYPMHFRVGGWHETTEPSIRSAIDAAIAQEQKL